MTSLFSISPRILISVALGILPVFSIAIGLYDVVMRWIDPPSRKVLPYPPGPSTTQLLGNRNWKVFGEWAKKYGDIIHFKTGKEHHIVLHRAEDAIELLEKRSGIYSDRKLSVTMEIVTTSTILSVLCGDNLSDEQLDFLVQLSDTKTNALAEFGASGSSVIDSYPSLSNIPTWFPSWVPGVKEKRAAMEIKTYTDQMLEEPMRLVGKELMYGTAGASVVADLLEHCYVEKEYKVMRELAASGSETMVAALEFFFLAITLYPEVQAKAQEEIDRVVGRTRLPNFEDRQSLPYTDALYRELLRWRPPINLGVPHIATDNDVYRGYYIPKGSSIIPNIWSMTRDETRYPDPETLKPERYLNPDGTLNDDDLILTFGFGRRVCPGKDFSGNTTWLTIVSVLSLFKISKKDSQVNGVTFSSDGTVRIKILLNQKSGNVAHAPADWRQPAGLIMAVSDFVSSHLLISLSIAIIPLFSIAIGLYDLFMRYFNPFGLDVLPYPPGPPPASYIAGHITQLPKTRAWEGYADWAKQYGNIVYFRIYREHNIILHRLEDVIELFEKRSGIYSDRKHSVMNKMMGWEFNTGLKVYDNSWRHHRRMLKKHFDKDKIHAYVPVQAAKMKAFLKSLLDTPDDFRLHVKRLTTSTILSILYGHNLDDVTIDDFVNIAEKAVDALVDAMIPGSSVVDQLPILQHVPTWFPAWFPGVKFKRLSKTVYDYTFRMQEEPIKLVSKELVGGAAGNSLVAELLEHCQSESDYINTREMTATAYAAGAETTVAGLEIFFLAMMLFPDVQRKAQIEIDQVTGKTRLVDLDDRPALPYIEALFRELMRWRPPMPFPVARTVTDNDVYRGYYIPKGTVLLANTWAIAHNEEKYPEPDILRPERFLNADGSINDDDFILTFGFGRRICPGRYLAGSTTWLTIASVLSAFNIRTKDGMAPSAFNVSTDGPPRAGYFSGNASQLPQSRSWLTYTDWGKDYGDIIHFTVYGEHTIILNRLEDTIELLEKRSGLYSSRKQSTMTKLMGWDFNFGLKPYGNLWRYHRRIMRKYFDKRPSAAYAPVQTAKARQFLKDLLRAPEEFLHYGKRATTAIIMAILYGFNISDENIDYFVHLSEIATGKLAESMIPGAAVVDALPFLQHVPGWVPGAQFQRHAAYVKKYADAMLEAPMKLVKEQTMQGEAATGVVAELLAHSDDENVHNRTKDMSATTYAAASDTLTSAFASFFLAMVLYPDIQSKAQAAIDKVTGRDRLPTFEDRDSLPYIEALIWELLRWRPPLPLNVPHYTIDEDVYKGYYIPKGTVVVANIWAMSRNEDVYPNAEEYIPERFLNKDGSLKRQDEFLMSFGSGRRSDTWVILIFQASTHYA
ncbi:hypothetical protein CVT24_004381 [Panaeolus cyanescens]|uniref:Cytochrome P450 n=1 Tax=Panaeolus cyanescens TaxID=181874 RepID=A0A409VA10_9AGAR|nr:hypothetical protein CVT24_004381 [Panaeolus cyanescens]